MLAIYCFFGKLCDELNKKDERLSAFIFFSDLI